MNNLRHLIFVYGTLRKGDCRGDVADTRRAEEAYVNGFALYDLGAFPGVVHAYGSVRGEILEVDSEMLKLIDSIEGYYPEQPGMSLYIREKVIATTDSGEELETWIYTFNHANDLGEPIQSGDWFLHKGLY